MSGVIDVVSRPFGEDDISFGQNSFVFVDINGVPQRIGQVNAASLPWKSIPSEKVEALVDGSKVLPVSASQLQVLNTSILSGPVYGSGTTSGYVKNRASGLLLYGQAIATADVPSGIPASNIGSGTVSDEVFGYIANLTSDAQSQINTLSGLIGTVVRIQYFQPRYAATVVWASATTANVNASADCPAMVCMNGFPDVVNPELFTSGSLSNGKYYQNTVQTQLVFPNNLYGTEQANQWYAVLANTASSTPLDTFALNGMPYLRAKSEASQVIHCGTNADASVSIGYTFTANEFVNGKIYVLSGTQAGQIRTIAANNASNTDSTVTYTGAALSLAQGDWFIILPPNLNFRRLTDAFNDGSSNMTLDDIWFGKRLLLEGSTAARMWVYPFVASALIYSIIGGGGDSSSQQGGHGAFIYRGTILTDPGTVASAQPGTGGGGGAGTPSYVAGLFTAAGGLLDGGTAAADFQAEAFGVYGLGAFTTGATGNDGKIVLEYY